MRERFLSSGVVEKLEICAAGFPNPRTNLTFVKTNCHNPKAMTDWTKLGGKRLFRRRTRTIKNKNLSGNLVDFELPVTSPCRLGEDMIRSTMFVNSVPSGARLKPPFFLTYLEQHRRVMIGLSACSGWRTK